MNVRLIATATLLGLTGWGCTQTNDLPPADPYTLEADGVTSITAKDQLVFNGVVTIDRVEIAQDVWLVVQADENGQPGKVVGRATYAGRTLSNLDIPLAANTDSPVLHLSVHADNGSKGQYEPNTEDKLLTYQGVPALTRINVTYRGTSNNPEIEQNPIINTSTPDPIGIEVNIDTTF